MKYLGETLDIHTGGVDHIPTHHNNEIAQSEAATGKPFARFWLHNAHLMVEDKKISKSAGTAFYLSDLEKKGFLPLSLRYFFLGANYDTQMNFTWEGLEAAKTAYAKLLSGFGALKKGGGKIDPAYERAFKESIEDNLNTPKALSILWELMKDPTVAEADKRKTILSFDQVLGLDIDKQSKKIKESESVSKIPKNLKDLLEQRDVLRKNKEWAKADEIRKEIERAGFAIVDSEEGAILKRIS